VELSEVGWRIRVHSTSDGEYGREWLRGLVVTPEASRLVDICETDSETVGRLQR
jgi:A/G-specific adenine glycosylase